MKSISKKLLLAVFFFELFSFPFFSSGNASAQLANQPLVQEKNVNVIMANFSDTQDQPWSRQQLQNQLFGSTGSISEFYKENSYGKFTLTGNVYGWYKLPIAQTCDTNSVFDEAKKAAKQDPSYSDNGALTLVIAPFGPGYCGWVGYSLMYEPLIAVVSTNSNYLSTIAHELGHAIGFLHASFYNCQEATKADYNDCTTEEYGDQYDVMGSGLAKLVHFDAPHKDFAGWFSPGEVATVTQSGQYTLAPIETSGNGVKALKIQRKPDQFYYVEFRQPIGFDQNLAGNNNIFNGALIHVAGSSASKSYLINPLTPYDGSNPVLPVGKSFTDSVSGLTITVSSLSMGALTVDVKFGGDTKASGISAAIFKSGTLVQDQKTVYLISGQEKTGFASPAVFKGLGYSWEDVVPGDTSAYAVSAYSPLKTSGLAHPPGSWILSKKTIYYVSEAGPVPVPSWDVFISNGGDLNLVVKANPQDLKKIAATSKTLPLAANDERIGR